MILGLTGSVGSGKSTVSAMLRECGAFVVCADQLAKEVVAPGSPALSCIRDHFGPGVFHADGSLDRKALASLVFTDTARLKVLESIIHPLVRERELALIESHRSHPLVVLDVPLLFESGMDDLCDKVLVVFVTERVREERLLADRGWDVAEVRRRLGAQIPQEQKLKRADYSIDNSGTREATRAQVEAIVRQLVTA